MSILTSTQPKPEPEFSSTPEPELLSTPEPELYSTPEPETSTAAIITRILRNFTVTAEPEKKLPEPENVYSGFELSPEPEPEFDIAREVWGGAWPAHIYIFAFIFTLLMFYNLNSFLGLYRSRRGAIRRKKIFLLTNFLLFFFNFITALHLFINPYESQENFRIQLPGLLFIFFGLRLPCLTGAFSLILITLIETTKVKLYSKKLQNIWYLLGVISVHFIVVIAIHFYLVFHQDQFHLIAICQMFYILFGLVVSATVLFSYFKIRQHLLREEEALTKIIYRSFRFGKGKKRGKKKRNGEEEVEINVEKNDKKEEKIEFLKPRSPFVDRSLRRLFAVAVLISISGLLYCVAVLYALATMLAESHVSMEPWPWLTYQTLARLAEVGMVIGMSYLVRRNIIPCCAVIKDDERSRTVTLNSTSVGKI